MPADPAAPVTEPRAELVTAAARARAVVEWGRRAWGETSESGRARYRAESLPVLAAVWRKLTLADLPAALLDEHEQQIRAKTDDIYEMRERGLRVLGDEQCCELACNGGACESCPCCCAGWCVSGHSGEIPERDLTPQSDYRIWLAEAAEHNPVAKLLANLEGVADVEYDEPAAARGTEGGTR